MLEVAKQQGAEILKVDKWGRRKLAYDIGKQRDGYYVLFHMNAEQTAVRELERKFKMNDAVIRFLTVRLDDEVRRARRRAAIRARRKGLEPGAEVPVGSTRPRDEASGERTPARGAGGDEDEGEV